MNDFEIKKGVLKQYYGKETHIVIPEEVHTIGEYAFVDNQTLQRLTLTKNVKTIENAAFLRCPALQEIYIPESVETIGDGAFYQCEGVKTVFLTDNVKTLKYSAFDKLISLEKFEIVFHHDDIADFAKQIIRTRWIYLYFLSGKLKTDAHLEEELIKRLKQKSLRTYIVEMIFQTETAASLARLLSFFKKLSAEELGGYIEKAPNAEFRAVLLSYKNEKYSADALEKIENIEMEKALGIRKKTISDFRKIFKLSERDGVYHITGYKGKETSLVIPAEICGKRVEIGQDAFKNCETLERAEIEEGITAIGYQAFYWCRNLKEVIIPESVKTIGDYAFHYCGISEIKLPEGLTKIGCGVFARTPLKKIALPIGVTLIGRRMFYECKELEEVILSPNTEKIERLSFWGCKKLKQIFIPASVTEIEEYVFSEMYHVDIQAPKGSVAWHLAEKRNGFDE